jgi:hypothetical protein
MKVLNQLRMIEDSMVIYRIVRAPERRIFYIDVGDLPKTKAEQYMKRLMDAYKNKQVYDSTTGDVRDDRKHMSMLEDFWLPRRNGTNGTQVDTLRGGDNLDKMEDVMFFQKNLYQALNVPISRLDSNGAFNLGRATEITRDELDFAKFIGRLRARFSSLFDDLLRTQLSLKNIVNIDEWEEIRTKIKYQFSTDSYFAESKEMEILHARLNLLKEMGEAENTIGKYFSVDFVRKNILKQTDEQIKEIDKQIKEEKAKYDSEQKARMEAGLIPDPSQQGGNEQGGSDTPAPKPIEKTNESKDKQAEKDNRNVNAS